MKKLSWTDDPKRDILSYLPDPIRSHVVSYLPMKDAIRTKILSRRWRKICTSLSNLEFCSRDFKNLLYFRNFVDKTLIFHDGSDVRKFGLSIDVDEELISADHFNTWITFAVDHNVEDLRFTPWPKSKIERLPCCFFTCSTLSVIYLRSLRNLKWPTLISFPNLKVLNLHGIVFRDENVSSKLFSDSACPLLERLSIFYCKFKGIHTLSISFSTLKYLQLHCVEALNVNLSIPILSEFDYACPLPPNISCETLSSICQGSFEFDIPDSIAGELALFNSVRKIFTGLHNVEDLALFNGVIEVLNRDPILSAYLPSSYCSLKHLFFIITPTKSHIEVIACLLRTSPNLQTLGIRFEAENLTSSNIIHMHGYWELNELPECLKHLKSAKLIDFGGRECEMDIVRRLLRLARNLEEVHIFYACEVGTDAVKRMKISEKLSSFRRVSPHATIIFSMQEQ
ncbi:hypothetical protein ACHQM5_004106 [Ranunculus cassubicifolius]